MSVGRGDVVTALFAHLAAKLLIPLPRRLLSQ